MKVINTIFTEKQFVDRLGQHCRLKTRLDAGYNDIDTFVCKIKGNRFWLGKHYASVGKTDGFSPERLNCKYDMNESGRVIVRYQRAKHPSYAIFYLLAFVIGTTFCVDSFINAFEMFDDFRIDEFIFALAFLVIGLFGLIIKPRKEWLSLEEHLHKICDIE